MHVVLGITNGHCLACHYWMYESAIVCAGIVGIGIWFVSPQVAPRSSHTVYKATLTTTSHCTAYLKCVHVCMYVCVCVLGRWRTDSSTKQGGGCWVMANKSATKLIATGNTLPWWCLAELDSSCYCVYIPYWFSELLIHQVHSTEWVKAQQRMWQDYPRQFERWIMLPTIFRTGAGMSIQTQHISSLQTCCSVWEGWLWNNVAIAQGIIPNAGSHADNLYHNHCTEEDTQWS